MSFENYRNKLIDLLGENKVVKKLYIFGSALTPQFDENKSDIDIFVETEELTPVEKGESLILLWDNLEQLFNRKIDLLTDNSLKNPYLKKEIETKRKLIYDGQSKQIFI